MKQVETTGKKVEDAIENGLRELGVSQSEVNIEILTLPGLFRRAKVRLTVVDENGNPVEEKVAEVKKEEKIVVKKEEKPAIKKEEKKFEKREVKEVKKEQKPEKKFEKSEIKKEQKVENKVEKKEVPAEQPKTEQPSEDKKIAEQQVEIARNYLSKLLSFYNLSL